MRSTGHAWSYKAWCSAVISCFSTALIGAFRSLLISDLLPRRSAVARLSCCCVSWSWASTLLEFLFHSPCWCRYGEVLYELPLWLCACSTKGHDQWRQVWHHNFKRTRRPTHHQRIQEAHAHRSILSVRFTPPSISKTRYCQVPLRARQRSRRTLFSSRRLR